MSPMRICLLAPDLYGKNGWSRYALDLARSLSERGHHVTCIVEKMSGVSWCREIALLRGPLPYLELPLLVRFDAWRLGKLLRREQPDVVHVIAEPYALLLTHVKHPTWKNVLTIHGTYAVSPFRFGASTRRTYAQAMRAMDHIVSVSSFTKERLKESEPELFAELGLEGKIRVIHNGITVPAPTERTNHDGIARVLTVSGLVKRRKGFLQAVRACAAFKKTSSVPFRYEIIGDTEADPAFVRELRNEIDALGLREQILFRGPVTDEELADAYASADVYLMPSADGKDSFEGFGLVFLEANAYGTPVIGSSIGGAREAIDNGVTGYACDPDDTVGIAAAMRKILVDHAIDPAACRRFAEEHDVRKVAVEFERLYAS